MSEETSWDQRHQQLLRENEQLREFTETLRAGAAKNLKRAEKLESELRIATAERQIARDALAAMQAATKPGADMRATYPHRIVVTFSGPEFVALFNMAKLKRRTAQEQILWLVAKAGAQSARTASRPPSATTGRAACTPLCR
ncbi:MAG: hypothetical protein KAX65_11425 [Caldilineaceae bacterium]|nr:hypothetical protein [Caldilineaceae bacterium]